AGVLIDRLGARTMLIASLAGTGAVATLLAVLDTERIVVALLVLLLGMTSQAMAPAFHALVALVVPLERLRGAYSLTYIGLGFALAPLLGGRLARRPYRLISPGEAVFTVTPGVVALLLPKAGDRAEPVAPDTDSTEIPHLIGEGLGAVLRDRVFIKMAVWNVL